jgi:hypothetical protein
MTPLNSILNLSDLMIAKARGLVKNANGNIKLDVSDLENDIETLKVINSSTQMMKLMN